MSKHPNIACHQTLLLVCNTVSRYIIKTSCKLLAKKGDREIKQCYTFSQNKKKHPEIYTLGTLSNRQDFCVLEKALRTSLHRCPVSQSVVSVLSLFISTYFRVSGDRKNHRSCSDQLCKDMKIKPWGRRARCLCVCISSSQLRRCRVWESSSRVAVVTARFAHHIHACVRRWCVNCSQGCRLICCVRNCWNLTENSWKCEKEHFFLIIY